jgi:hypothetical protein
MGIMLSSLWIAMDVQSQRSPNGILFADNLDLPAPGGRTWPSATQAVMKRKVESPKNRSIPKNLFCQAAEPSFLLGKCPFLGKQSGGKEQTLNECLLLLLLPGTPLLPFVTLRFMTACVALGP